MPWPNFLLIGTPKGGTTALHAALVQHPQLHLSSIKEPKYFLVDDQPPRRHDHRGPGDAHSAREWVWRRSDYLDLFDAPAGTLAGESTPFYLYDRAAQQRIAATIPDVKMIAVVRDPVDRAYSNWAHLWADGLEPVDNFIDALALEDERVALGYAPFWHYARLGRYGEQLQHLYSLFDRDQVLVLRYRQLVDEPDQTVATVSEFLGVEDFHTVRTRAENVHPYVRPGRRASALGHVIRAGAAAGAYAPPSLWRTVEAPLRRIRHTGGGPRPKLTVDERRGALQLFSDDIELLEQVTGQSFADWRKEHGRGAFSERRRV